jgi:hypothetical protein
VTISQCAARIAVMLGMVLVSACATTSYSPQLFLSSTNDVQCPANSVLMCKNVDSAQTCSCTSTAMFWAD